MKVARSSVAKLTKFYAQWRKSSNVCQMSVYLTCDHDLPPYLSSWGNLRLIAGYCIPKRRFSLDSHIPGKQKQTANTTRNRGWNRFESWGTESFGEQKNNIAAKGRPPAPWKELLSFSRALVFRLISQTACVCVSWNHDKVQWQIKPSTAQQKYVLSCWFGRWNGANVLGK